MVRVIGLGTGRCGTRSLTRQFNNWAIPATHETYRLFWEPNREQFEGALKTLKADVGFYWLNYVPWLVEEIPGVKCVCLKREKEKVVTSYMKSIKDPMFCSLIWSKYNVKLEPFYYRDTVTQEQLNAMDESTREFVEAAWDIPMQWEQVRTHDHFPDYNIEDRRESIERFWDEYYEKSILFSEIYTDNFMLIGMHEALNTETGRNKIKNFIGVTPNTMAQ